MLHVQTANNVRIIIYPKKKKDKKDKKKKKDFGFNFEHHIFFFLTTKENSDNFSPQTLSWQKAWAAVLKFNDTESLIK